MSLDLLFNAPLWLLGLLAIILLGLLAHVIRSGVQSPGNLPSQANEVPGTLALHGLSGEVARQHYLLRSNSVRIGRDPDANDIILPFPTISARHARIEYRQGAYFLRDLGSLNGTRLNGELFSSGLEERERPIHDGDRITFDTYEFRLAAAPAETPGPPGKGKLDQTSVAAWFPATLGTEVEESGANDRIVR